MVEINNYSPINYKYEFGSKEHKLLRAKMLIMTPRGSLPLDRGFGYDPKLIDKPSTLIKTALKVDLERQFKKYIPEIVIHEVVLEHFESHEMRFRIKIEVD